MNLYCRSAYQMLENPTISKVCTRQRGSRHPILPTTSSCATVVALNSPQYASLRCSQAEAKGLRATVIMIIATAVSRYGTQLISGVATALIHLCSKFEHAPACVANLVALMANEMGNPALGNEMVTEIGAMSPKDLARDASGCRSLSLFLCEVTELAPKLVLSNLPMLMPHFDGENYPMRSGLAQVRHRSRGAVGRRAEMQRAGRAEGSEDDAGRGDDSGARVAPRNARTLHAFC